MIRATRRSLLIGSLGAAGALLLPRRYALAGAPTFEGVPIGNAPGDKGFRHHEFHPFYQDVFEDHCACGEGECRVTDWRETEMGSPSGYDVIAYRKWVPLPSGVYIPPPETVPVQLRKDRAHILCLLSYRHSNPLRDHQQLAGVTMSRPRPLQTTGAALFF